MKHRRFLTGYLFLLLLGVSVATPFWTTGQSAETDVEAHPLLVVKGTLKSGVVGLTPNQIRQAYGFSNTGGAGQTIGIVEAYDHSKIEDDLAVFNETFSLPPCTTQNGCFEKVYADGNPGTRQIWSLETALDVEWAHAIAPQARILLVASKTNKLVDLIAATRVAIDHGANVVSMSWGAIEFAGQLALDNLFQAEGVTFVAGSGDLGIGLYPAASPFVIGVGGTTLTLDQNGFRLTETAWSGSGGGLSVFEPEPGYQVTIGIPAANGKRGIPDVAYNGDPDTGFAVYTSKPYLGTKGWLEIAGTSAGAPQWSALIAIANSLRAANNKPPLTGGHAQLYSSPSNGFYDVSPAGFDYATGLGTPRADVLIQALSTAD